MIKRYTIILLIYAEIAQLVEQLSRNQQVVGSSPIFGTRLIDTRTFRDNIKATLK